MKKLFLVFFALVAMILSLCACGKCKHSWKLADCETPKHCSICGEAEGEPRGHTWLEATCLTSKKCSACGKIDAPPLEHNWVMDKCDEPVFCTLCGDKGEIKGHIWSESVCLEAPVCNTCGEIGNEVKHEWKSASCETPKTCIRCGAETGEPNGHIWQGTTCLEPKKCTVCNATTMEDLKHSWVFNGCTEKRSCRVCNAMESEPYGHNWIDASCALPKTCQSCRTTEGEALGHLWQEATCTVAKNCTRCNHVEGEALGHEFSLFKHVAPNCKDGYDEYRCHCGESQIKTYSANINYHLLKVDGICQVCQTQFDLKKLTLYSVSIGTNNFSMERCGEFTSEETTQKILKPITYEDIGMPVVDLGGALPTAKGPVNKVEFTYLSSELSFECFAEIKVQGASSAGYPKKNFNIKLIDEDGSKNKVTLVDQWGKEHKYCMKANYIDYSQARNVVSAQIFGEIVRSRNDELKDLPNGGAIDGYPILVYNDGIYQGVYTMNIPKDKWMLDMKESDEKNQAILMTDSWGDSVAFRTLSTSHFELEFASNEESSIDNDTKWVYDSMLNLISFVLNNDGEDFVNGIHQYADVDKCIDSMLYTFFICADDNISKNILWITYDGKVWFSSMYDMDGTWGMRWNGHISFDENTHPISAMVDGKGIAPERNPSNYNLLWEKIYINFFDRVCQRYAELRQDILTEENITEYFTAFFDKIPDVVRKAEYEKWTSVPSRDVNHLEQILTFAKKRIEVFDRILMSNESET